MKKSTSFLLLNNLKLILENLEWVKCSFYLSTLCSLQIMKNTLRAHFMFFVDCEHYGSLPPEIYTWDGRKEVPLFLASCLAFGMSQ